MKFSQMLIPTLREAPRDADTVSAKLMIRSGMIRKLAAGLFEWLPLGLRVLKNVERIVREEMNSINGQEVWLPHVQPRELWEETGRWQVYGKELLRIKDRKNSDFCFAPTAEEVITDLIRRDVRSYRQLPVMCYQFGTKFRDEIRPRFGVMRAREFYMKDAYSFHADEKDAEQYYAKVYDAYCRIFKRCGFDFRPVEADTGAIGGSFSHEFMVIADTGEEEIASCECGYAANVERAECLPPEPVALTEPELPLEDVHTPNAWTVEDVSALMGLPKEKFIKTMFYLLDGVPAVALMRGDSELNEAKLLRAFGAKTMEKMSEEGYSKLAGCDVGYAGPVKLKERCGEHDSRSRIAADHLVKNIVNGASGANKKDYHTKNVNPGRDFEPDSYMDIRKAVQGDICPRCGANGKRSVMKFSRGIEVGHTFKLGTKYSDAMKAVYLDEAGQSHSFIMGCYGIGVSRVVAASIEQQNDANGIIWGKEIAPFQAIIIPVKYEEPKTREWTDSIYDELKRAGIETIVDDRPERAGVKFKDADLIGIPLRITIGEKGLEKGTVEVKLRRYPDITNVPRENLLGEVQKFLERA